MKLTAIAVVILALGIVVGFAPLSPARRTIATAGKRAKKLSMQDTGSESKNCLDCGEPLSEQVMAAGLARCTPCSAEFLRSAQGEPALE